MQHGLRVVPRRVHKVSGDWSLESVPIWSHCSYISVFDLVIIYVLCVFLVKTWSRPRPTWWYRRDSWRQAMSTLLLMIAGCPTKGTTTVNCSQTPRGFHRGWRLWVIMWAIESVLLFEENTNYVKQLQVHGLGLKFGIYEDYGNFTCGGYPGVLGHLETDAKTLASWGADYIKLDGCYADLNDMEQGMQKISHWIDHNNELLGHLFCQGTPNLASTWMRQAGPSYIHVHGLHIGATKYPIIRPSLKAATCGGTMETFRIHMMMFLTLLTTMEITKMSLLNLPAPVSGMIQIWYGITTSVHPRWNWNSHW